MKGKSSKVKTFDPFAGTGIRDIYGQIQDITTPVSNYLTPYQGQIVPGASQLQQAGFGLAGGLTPLAGQFRDISSGMLGNLQPGDVQRYGNLAYGGLQNIMKTPDIGAAMTAMEPMRQYGMDVFREDIVPYIMEKYGPQLGAAQSGAMYQQLGREGGRLANQLGSQLGQNALNLYSQQLGMQPTAVNLAQQGQLIPGQLGGQAGYLGGLSSGLAGDILGFGGQQRGILSEQMQEPYMKWQYPYSPGQMQMLQLGLQEPGMQSVVKQGTQGFGSSLMAGLAPVLGAGIAGGLGGALLPNLSVSQGFGLGVLGAGLGGFRR